MMQQQQKSTATKVEYLDISIYAGNRVLFSDMSRKLGKSVLDVVRNLAVHMVIVCLATDSLWNSSMAVVQVNEGTVDDLPGVLEIGQKWRAILKGSKIRRMERSTYRLNHIHARVIRKEQSDEMPMKSMTPDDR
ncbi:hypothetical protein FI667_g3857, partial [Globisporangium splendens]